MPRWYPTRELARPVYYDRNAVSRMVYTFGTRTPHGTTMRASYSPPFPYAAFIESIYLAMVRQVAASAVGIAAVYVEYLPFQGGVYIVDECDLYNGTAFANAFLTVPSFGYMAYGDAIRILTVDLSTGGSISMNGAIKHCEFDY